MTKTELNIRLDLHRRELRTLESIKVGCQTCEHYLAPNCTRFEVRPPAEVLQQGCDDWTYDFIPF